MIVPSIDFAPDPPRGWFGGDATPGPTTGAIATTAERSPRQELSHRLCRVILKNNPNPPDPHQAQCAATFDVVLETECADHPDECTICESPSTQKNGCSFDPGAGGNPIVCVDLRPDSSSSGDICLGRCNQL